MLAAQVVKEYRSCASVSSLILIPAKHNSLEIGSSCPLFTAVAKKISVHSARSRNRKLCIFHDRSEIRLVTIVWHFLIKKKITEKRQRGAEKGRKRAAPREKKEKWQKKVKKERKKNQKCCILLSPCAESLLLAWTSSETCLGRTHRLAWDYFSVFQFWIELLLILATYIVPSQSPHISFWSAQVQPLQSPHSLPQGENQLPVVPSTTLLW